MLKLRILGAGTALLTATALAGCGGGADASADGDAPVTITVTERTGTIEPDDGHVVMVRTGQEIVLKVSSDVDDEIHVHSEPEHEFEVPAGQDQTFTFAVDEPGTYLVESHGLEVTVVKLQVRP